MKKMLGLAGMAASLFTGGSVASAQSAQHATMTPSAVAAPGQTTPRTPPPSNQEMGNSVFDRLILQASAGVSLMTIQADKRSDKQHSEGISLTLDVGIRLTRYLGMGIHLGQSIGSVELFYNDDLSNEPGYFYQADYNPLEIGAALYLHPTEQIWMTPWIGRTDFPVSRTENYKDTKLAYGVELGADLATASRGTHRLGGYASLTLSEGYYRGEGVSSFSMGLSYRYR
jgi:hypothetical protein